MTVWKPIEEYESSSFEPLEVWVKAEGHKPILASFGWDEEYYDGWSDAWHIGTSSDSLGFIPEEWCYMNEYKEPEITTE